MAEQSKINQFSVVVYGELENYNDVLSKSRCRIFYKGANRNGTYITDDFANKLISTLPYVPVKGIYDSMNDDYTDHGKERNLGRIYGIVPENPNFAWETHLDEDGVMREYACADVLLFTALYGEANDIVGKAESMELYNKSIKGEWQEIKGQRYFVFTEGSFLGLQVLGDDVEPCFEGAAFFTLYDSIKQMIDKIEEFNLKSQNNDTGGKQMADINFKLSDGQKYSALWTLLNPNFTEEGEWTIDNSICAVYDDYALVYSCKKNKYSRAYYTKNDADDTVSITSTEAAYILDVNESEKNTLDSLRKINGDTYEKVDEKFTELTEKNSEFSNKIEEQEVTIATLTQNNKDSAEELETVKSNYTESTKTIESLTTEIEGLKEFQNKEVKAKKEAVIASYSEQLDEEALKPFNEKIDEYSIEDLDKELAYTLVKAKPALFSENQTGFVPKDNGNEGGIEAILSKYKK